MVPGLRAGQRVLVVSHGDTLRGLAMHLENISAEAIPHLEVPSGVPLVIHFGPGLTVRGHTWLDGSDATEPH